MELHLPGVRSLKEKRRILKGLIARIHKKYNVSCAEVALNDVWQSASVGIAVATNNAVHAQRVLDRIEEWVEIHRPDLMIVGRSIEIIHT